MNRATSQRGRSGRAPRMIRLLRRWPPLLWILVYVGSLFILMGRQRVDLLIAGAVLCVVALVAAIALTAHRRRGEPRPPGAWWWIGGVAAFYAITATVAGATLGIEYAGATLLAGVVPATAVSLMLASARRKTRPAGGEDVRDVSPEADDDPFPSIGMDSETALGDAPELSDAQEDPMMGRRRRLLSARRRATGRPTHVR